MIKKIHQPLPTRKLNKPPQADRSVNAAHVIVELPVPLALLVSMDAMVSMDSQANQEIVVHQPQMEPFLKAPFKNNAHAQLHLVIVAHKDHEAQMDPQAMLVHQVPMVNQAVLDQLDHPDQLAIQETQAPQDPQAMLAKLLQDELAHQAHPVPTANPVLLAQLVNPVDQAKMVALAVQALPEMPVLQVVLAKLAAPVAQEIPVVQVLQAVANTAHQLVWLQVIKRRQRTLFSGNAEYRKMSVYAKRPSVSIDSFPKCISASCVFTSQF